MCGLVGYFKPKTGENLNELYHATSLISHRGPDDEGYAAFNLDARHTIALCGPDSPEILKASMPDITQHMDYPHQLAFGFRRFSIVDLSEKGHQPFWSQDRSVCLTFNGEVYNYVEIRQELKALGYSFTTSSDTEVLLVGYQAWGLDILKHCNGPLALAIYDQTKNKLFLARDRIGKNPLYYAIHQGALYWASEIKAILSMTGRSAFTTNEQAVYDYLNFGWRDLDNTTFWEGINTLPAASWTSIDLSKPPAHQHLSENLTSYWKFPSSRLSSRDISFREAMTQFSSLFSDAVRIRSRADAKVAFSLSGGMDSSSIVATAANILPTRFRTYSIKFPGQPYDEEPFAHKVYQRYPDMIDYQTYTPGNEDFWQVADDFIWQQEEPFHWPDTELFRAYLRKARKDDYKVVIVGGGGDELLAGYQDYFFPLLMLLRDRNALFSMTANLFLRTSIWPKYCIRKRLRILKDLFLHRQDSFQKAIPPSFFNRGGQSVAIPYLKDTQIMDRIRDRRNELFKNFDEMLVGYMSNWLMQYWQRNTDKSHFSVPIESRRPFLDYRLIDFMFTLPPEYIMHNGWTKYILRKSIHPYLPKEVTWRRQKQGMPFNTQSWFTHAKPIVQRHLETAGDNPFLNVSTFAEDYDLLLEKNAPFLWRGINLVLWWKRVIMQTHL